MRRRSPLLLGACVLLGACAPGARARPPRTLPPDSQRVLERAIRMARPAFATQEEALRAGIYAAPAPTAATLPAAGSALPPAATRAPAGPPPVASALTLPYRIQVAAYRDRASAEVAAAAAGRALAGTTAVVEEGEGWFRVALAGWATEREAEAALPRVRAVYPSAWIRRPAFP